MINYIKKATSLTQPKNYLNLLTSVMPGKIRHFDQSLWLIDEGNRTFLGKIKFTSIVFFKIKQHCSESDLAMWLIYAWNGKIVHCSALWCPTFMSKNHHENNFLICLCIISLEFIKCWKINFVAVVLVETPYCYFLFTAGPKRIFHNL